MRSLLAPVLLLNLALLSPAPASAHGTMKLDRMTEELQLSEEQAQAVKQIMEERQEAFRALHQTEGDWKDKRARMEALRAQTREKLASVLNADQMQRMEAMMERRGDRRDEAKDRIGKLREELQLSDEQSQAVHRIMEQQREKMHTLFKSGEDRSTIRAKMDSLRTETHELLAAVLNEEQMARMEQLHKEHHGPHHRHRGEDRRSGPDQKEPAPGESE